MRTGRGRPNSNADCDHSGGNRTQTDRAHSKPSSCLKGVQAACAVCQTLAPTYVMGITLWSKELGGQSQSSGPPLWVDNEGPALHLANARPGKGAHHISSRPITCSSTPQIKLRADAYGASANQWDVGAHQHKQKHSGPRRSIKPRRCHLLRATPPIATGADHQRRARLAPLHFWLTNRINIPTAINRATRVPTASERTRFRRSSGFDPAPFCAAPMSNQKRNLSIERYLAQNRRCFPPEFGMMLSEALAKLNRRTAQ